MTAVRRACCFVRAAQPHVPQYQAPLLVEGEHMHLDGHHAPAVLQADVDREHAAAGVVGSTLKRPVCASMLAPSVRSTDQVAHAPTGSKT